MASVLNRTTKEFRGSVNTPDFPVIDWIINPDLSAVAGLPTKYWKITGDVVTAMSQAERDVVDDNEVLAQAAAADGEVELFGDGNDGDIVESVSRTLTQDLYPRAYMINAGVIIDNGGFRVVAKRCAILHGVFRANGGDAAGATGGAAAPTGTIGGGTAGSTGTNGAGTASANLNNDVTPGQGGRGGQGGAGSNGAGANGGQIRTGANARTRSRRLDVLLAMADVDNANAGSVTRFQGGTGGGSGGGGGGANLGGGGGGGAGTAVLAAPVIFISSTGSLEAKGGVGGAGTSGNAGGGGGGGGGCIGTAAVVFRERNARNVSGGAGGAASGTGVAGGAGADGRTIHLRINAA